MGMGVSLGRHAMGGPASVRDSDLSESRHLLQCFVEHANLTHSPQSLQMLRAVEYGYPRRVIATVFQPVQPLHQDGHYVALRYRSDDSAHVLNLPLLTGWPAWGQMWSVSVPQTVPTRRIPMGGRV